MATHTSSISTPERRPLASRDLALMQALSRWLVRRGVSPNAISLSSLALALLSALASAGTGVADGVGARMLFVLAALAIQLRLLANLLDGMVAVDSGKSSQMGALYNEVPDRIADPIILLGAGLAAGSSAGLGAAASLIALFVAYVRALGGSLDASGLFVGPMAKPHRMAALTLGCSYCALAPVSWPLALGSSWSAIALTLALIVAGGALTAWRRLRLISVQLRARDSIVPSARGEERAPQDRSPRGAAK